MNSRAVRRELTRLVAAGDRLPDTGSADPRNRISDFSVPETVSHYTNSSDSPPEPLLPATDEENPTVGHL